MKISYAVLVFLLFCTSMRAEDNPRVPLISVTGTHEINVAPDEIKITINIDNREKLLQTAKSKTDEQAKQLIALAHTNEIQAKDIITSYVAVRPVYSYRKNEGRTILYFQAGQRITVTLHDFSKYDSFINSLTKEGFSNTLTEYDQSDLPGYRKKARINAILAAQEKARALAEAIGQKIGKAYTIKEVTQSSSIYQPNLASNEIAFSRASSQEEDSTDSPLSIGNIQVKVSVEVSFILE